MVFSHNTCYALTDLDIVHVMDLSDAEKTLSTERCIENNNKKRDEVILLGIGEC